MLKITSIAIIGALAFAPAAFAGAHTSKDRAQSMAGALKANKGFASVASTLGKSGTYKDLPKGGWGNIGSILTTANGAPVAKPDPKGVGPAE
ncbi:MAG: hypothetical protein GKR98_11555 [Boseongicola sp.]|nr:MAG: hypothetical protein GKR98_11555 [Boseongicola sp.]